MNKGLPMVVGTLRRLSRMLLGYLNAGLRKSPAGPEQFDIEARLNALSPAGRASMARGREDDLVRKAAVAALGGKPGAVDVTFAKVGDRTGYVLTVPRDGTLEIVVRSPELKGECLYRYDGMDMFQSATSPYPAAIGISEAGAVGVTIERGRVFPERPPWNAPRTAGTRGQEWPSEASDATRRVG